jgi:hypothetical protein
VDGIATCRGVPRRHRATVAVTRPRQHLRRPGAPTDCQPRYHGGRV